MTQDQLDAWRPRSVRGAADQLVAAGLMAAPDAVAWAQAQLDRLLADGVATPLHRLSTIRSGGRDECVGHLWTWIRPGEGDAEAFLMDVEITPEHRGRGLGRAAVVAAEQEAAGLGATVVRLNVYTHNRAAVRLYEGLGYLPTGMTVTRRLDAGAPDAGAGVDGAPVVTVGALTEADRSSLTRAGVHPDALLPVGPTSAGHRLWTARDLAGQPVAVVRLLVTERSDGRHVVGRRLEVVAGRRREGLGRAVVRVVEERCVAGGIRSVTMTLEEPTAAARALADRCGYRVAARTLARRLTGPGAGGFATT